MKGIPGLIEVWFGTIGHANTGLAAVLGSTLSPGADGSGGRG